MQKCLCQGWDECFSVGTPQSTFMNFGGYMNYNYNPYQNYGMYQQPTYQQQMTQPQMIQQTQQQYQQTKYDAPIQDIKFVTADEAKAYIVMPNTKVMLMDRDKSIF